MITPQNRLLFWFTVVVLPFAALGALYEAARPFAVALIAGLAVVAAVDAMLGHGRLTGVSLQLPAVIRLAQDRPGRVELQVRNDSRRAQHLRIGLPWPAEIVASTDLMRVSLPPDQHWSRVEWSCTARRRGNFHLTRAVLECASPLGLWSIRKPKALQAELRAYPNLSAERKSLATLFLHRGGLGTHAQRQVGKGRDFEKLRDYVPGDGLDEIHWKATAKRGHPVTKVFQVERTQEIYVVIDASRLSARRTDRRKSGIDRPASGEVSAEGSSGGNPALAPPEPLPTTLERFITAALVLGLAAEQQGDLFGLLTFADRVETFVRARTGRAHFDACRDRLHALEPRLVSPDFDELAAFIRLRLRRRALVVVLTALDDPLLAESFTRSVDLVSRQHLVLVNMLRPAGIAPLFSQPEVATVDDFYQELGGHLRWHKLRELERVLQRRGVRFGLLEDEMLAPQLVSQYLEVKQRQSI